MSITVISHAEVAKKRRLVSSAGNGEQHWRTDYLGTRGESSDSPEAFLIEMSADETLLPHFHAVDQFQVFVAGSGMLGWEPASPLTVHYADHHTGYGPIIASASGLSYFTFRPTTDPGAVYLNKPGYRDLLKPSQKRHSTSAAVVASIEPVLAARTGIAIEPLLKDFDAAGDVHASLLRLGPEMHMTGTDPALTGGQYYLVVSGMLELQHQALAKWSIAHLSRSSGSPYLEAGAEGAEVLLLQFPSRADRQAHE